MILTFWLAVAGAQAPATLDTRTLMRVAVMTAMVDQYTVRCEREGGLTAERRRALARWVETNRVEAVRKATPRLGPRDATQIDAIRTSTDSSKEAGLSPCQLLDTALRHRDAQFATQSPELLAALEGAPAAPAIAAPPGRPAPAPPVAAGLATSIDSFGFDSRTGWGFGGVTLEVYPVVLFKNGDLLTDVTGLAFPGGLAAHRAARAAAWTTWRRQGAAIQRLDQGVWKNLAFKVTYAQLPPAFRLKGRYSRLGGTGTIAVGGADSVAAWSSYQFWPDGGVIRGGGAAAYAEGGDSSVFTRAVAPDRRGRYTIDALTLTIAYADGSRDGMIIVTDPNDPDSVIWLDGSGFTKDR